MLPGSRRAPGTVSLSWGAIAWVVLWTVVSIVGIVIGAIALAKVLSRGSKAGPPGPPGTPAPIPSHSPTPSPLPAGCDIYGDTICAGTLEAGEVITELVETTILKTESICNDVLEHTQSGVLPPTHRFQTLQGAGVDSVAPAPVFDTVPFPLATLPLGYFSDGESFIIPDTPLRMTVIGTSLSVIDVGGEKVLQLGDPEPEFYYGYGYDDQASPGDNQQVGLRLSLDQSLLPSGAVTVTADFVFKTSSEYYYDFNTVNGPINVQFDGFGTIADPYMENDETSLAIYPGLPLQDVYVKDIAIYQGVDNCRLHIRNLKPAGAPPVPALGPAGLDMTLPGDLTPYVGKDIIVCANDDYHHTVNLTGTGLSFDRAGDYTELRFVEGAGCCATLLASSPTHLAVHTSHASCLAFCRPYGIACATDLNKLASVNAVYDMDQTGILPPTHSVIKLGGGGVAAFIPCTSEIEEYVGRRFTVVSDTSDTNRLIILEDPEVPCVLSFQIGDVITGRNPAKVLRMAGERGATVEFVVVSPTLISVVVNKDVQACDFDGNCAFVGDVLNPWVGWWTADNYIPNSELDFGIMSGMVFHVELLGDGNPNAMRVTAYAGGARYVYPSDRGIDGYEPGDYGIRSTKTWYQVAVDEITEGAPQTFGLQFRAKIDLANPNYIYKQSYPWGAETYFGDYPFIEIRSFFWEPRQAFFEPYAVFRRIGAPFGAGTSDPHGSTSQTAPALLHIGDVNQYFSGVESFRDRRFMFRWYVDTNMHTYGARFGLSGPKSTTNLRSWDEALDLRDKLETMAIAVTTNLVRFQKTANARLLTTVETDKFHSVNLASLVEIKGVTGPWAVINGVHRVAGAMQTRTSQSPPGSIDLGATPAESSLKYIFEIDFDSSLLPANATTGFYYPGEGTVTVTHGPVTAGAEYLAWVDAVLYWDSMILGDSIHHRPGLIINGLDTNPDRRCLLLHANWSEVQRDINEDPSGIHAGGGVVQSDPRVAVGIYGRVRKFNDDLSSRYVGQWADAFISRPEVANRATKECYVNSQLDISHGNLYYSGENDPTGLSYHPLYNTIDTPEKRMAHPLNENIVMHYCAEGQAFYPTWKVDGAPGPDVWGIEFLASTNYPPYDGTKGSYFVGGTTTYPDVPEDPNMSMMSDRVPLNGPCENTPGCNVTACAGGCTSNYQFIKETNRELWEAMMTNLYCCPLNTAYTDGVAIGYCYFADTTQGDPQTLETARRMAPPGLGGAGNPRGRREGASARMAPMMQRLFVNHSVTDMIVDIRGNSGGDILASYTFAEFFGAERNRSHGNLHIHRGEGQTPATLYQDGFDPYFLTSRIFDAGVRHHYPELNDAAYPGSVLTNGDVYIISNWRAGSGGDVFPQAFAGNDLDGDLGAGVRARVVGNPIGTLQGCADPLGTPLPASFGSKMLYDNYTGRPISPLFVFSERRCASAVFGDYETSSMYKIPLLYPKPLAALPGKSGGAALPHDYETLWHPDIGYIPNPRPTLPNWPHPQTPNISDPTTWRDAWLEATILEMTSGAKKRSLREPPVEFTAKVEYWRSVLGDDSDPFAAQVQSLGLSHACGDAELVPASEVPKRVIGQRRISRDADGESRSVYYIEGVQTDEIGVQTKFQHLLTEMMKDGVACEKADGTIGYTTKALEHGIPTIAMAA